MLAQLVFLFVAMRDSLAIKMSICSKQRCISEQYMTPQVVKGTFSWTDNNDSDLSVEVRRSRKLSVKK